MVHSSSRDKKIARYSRYFVPDLSPIDRKELKNLKPKLVFVGESPHTSEVEPEEENERRPLCGAAGKKWWGLLGELLGDGKGEDVSLSRLLGLCQKHRIAVINAVQYPLDSAISKKIPQAEPIFNLGFCKNSGPYSYKKLKQSVQVRRAIEALKERLNDSSMRGAQIHCLGNDADWFVKQALEPAIYKARVSVKLPHPSAWWRRGGYFGRTAKSSLQEILGNL